MSTDTDRGTAYGDGLFETMRVVGGRIPFWPEHQARLGRGAAALGLQLPVDLADQVSARATGHDECVLKLMVVAIGGAGYRRAWPAATDCLWSRRALPAPARTPVSVRWCTTTLGLQPRLAGCKHLNRLEQVLARSEWTDDGIYEGLVCDLAGDVIEATQMGLLVCRSRGWVTPLIDRCGVLSVVVARLLERGLVSAERLDRTQVESAQALALVSSVRGLVAVARLDDVSFPDAERRCAALKTQVDNWMDASCGE